MQGSFFCPKIKGRSLLCVLHSTTMPAALVECGFIDNNMDAVLLMNHQQEIAAAIARGVTDYWQSISK
ncbi:N-acetylmuramoyl-L-alanine amidase [uncultured Anaerovibrio sp.]|uniref:N-acetylmuramoyl-L-alanine amidase family protein n=1 Tax=uncultured Anaerovibrio sp. TaxID=361586 RepID=UPI002602E4A7|nr:N-acetylmuramoyl-L-alanine amidase [uncultured Anaerovibrio sp.]